MNNDRDPTPGTRYPTCPDFELLSRFADGELDEAGAGRVAAHLESCSRCTTLAARLQAGFGAEAYRDGGTGGAGCIGEEQIILYVTADLTGRERKAVEGHLTTCDRCLASVARVHRRLSARKAVEMAVPAAVCARAAAVLERDMGATVVEHRPRAEERERWLVTLGRRLLELFQLPVLVPAAVAIGVVAVVSVQQFAVRTMQPGDLSRAVSRPTHLRVTAAEAPVRREPKPGAEVIEKVQHGAELEIAGEERHWYQVVLPGERTGWIERDAFE